MLGTIGAAVSATKTVAGLAAAGKAPTTMLLESEDSLIVNDTTDGILHRMRFDGTYEATARGRPPDRALAFEDQVHFELVGVGEREHGEQSRPSRFRRFTLLRTRLRRVNPGPGRPARAAPPRGTPTPRGQ